MKLKTRMLAWSAVCAALLASAPTEADNVSAAVEKQIKLIQTVQSGAPQDKALACKQLAIYGDQNAVPALAPLLADPQLASWARIALEAIPGPAADNALREAMGTLNGRLLIGTINSIGFRRDAKAVEGLIAKLNDPDAGVIAAAAAALGRIGGAPAAGALVKALANAPTGARADVAEGCVQCAERFFAEGKADEAVKLYDTVRQSNAPRHKILEATRGAILARQNAGVPLLLELLRSENKAEFGIGLRTARELPGREATEALAAELGRTGPDRQAKVLLALADRNDPAASSTILKAAQTGSTPLRMAAFGVLERSGGISCVPVLLEAATDNDPAIAKTAKGALARLSHLELNADLLARLRQASGKTRLALIELTGQRQIEAALPQLAQYTGEEDAASRIAAVEAIGILGGEKQAADLVKLLQKSQNAKECAAIEKALLAICGRDGAACLPHILPLAVHSDSALRATALNLLAGIGGPEALAAIKTAVNDKDESVQDEAVRALSTWPDNWPDDAGVAESLLALARDGKKTSHQVLGLRGYLQYVQGDKKLQNEVKLAKVSELAPLIKRAEDKKQLVSVLATIPAAGALERLVALAEDDAVVEEACSAIVNLAGKNVQGATREQRQKALQTAAGKTKNDVTRKKADKLLQGAR